MSRLYRLGWLTLATAAFAMHIANGNGDLASSSIVKLLKPDVA